MRRAWARVRSGMVLTLDRASDTTMSGALLLGRLVQLKVDHSVVVGLAAVDRAGRTGVGVHVDEEVVADQLHLVEGLGQAKRGGLEQILADDQGPVAVHLKPGDLADLGTILVLMPAAGRQRGLAELLAGPQPAVHLAAVGGPA